MIEFKLLDPDCKDGWMEATSMLELDNINFKRAKLRIDGIEYKENYPELTEALRNALFWMKLQE